MSLEHCDICDELTGGAGRLDDSLVCANCNRVICGNCQADFDEIVICKQCAAKAFGIPLDRLEIICQAEKEGRCVVLPCKVGDRLYRPWKAMDIPVQISEWEVTEIKTFEDTLMICGHADSKKTIINLCTALDVGRDVFLTRAEAEAMGGEG